MNFFLLLLAAFVFSRLWGLLGSDPGVRVSKKNIVKLRPQDVKIKKTNFYPGFEEGEFLEGAEKAFDLILHAYHVSDRKTLGHLVTPSLLKSEFSQSPSVIPSKIYLSQSEIIDKVLKNRKALITVRFFSEQMIDDKVHESTDVWVFTRDLNSKDRNWLLTSVAP